jgi:integrase
MATIVKRDSGRWQARVRKAGGRQLSRTFANKSAAEAWARAEESDIDRGVWRDRSVADRTTMAALLKRYAEEVITGRKGAYVELCRVRRLEEDLGHLRLSAITPLLLAEWRDERLRAVASATVSREMTTLSGALTWARKELMIPMPEHPVAAIRRPPQGKPRERRLLDGEECRLMAVLQGSADVTRGAKRAGNYQTGARNLWIKPLVQLALETAMRQGELLALRWEHVNLSAQTAYLPDTKNGDSRTVPLSRKAVSVLQDLPRSINGRVLPITADAAKRAWTRALKRGRVRYERECEQTGVVVDPQFLTGLHFHDLRHEATSRLAEKLPNLIELAAVTGHKDLRMLKRYYHPRAVDLARKLG